MTSSSSVALSRTHAATPRTFFRKVLADDRLTTLG